MPGEVGVETIEPLLQACAGIPENYFYAPDAATLEQVFRDIGTRLSNIYLAR